MTASSSAAPLPSDVLQETPAGSLDDMPLEARLAHIERGIRAQPATATHRWALFQVLCVTGQWTRAIQQLQVYAQLSPNRAQAAQAYRDLIRAERRRAKVFAGRERPSFVVEPPLWVGGLINALRLVADGRVDEADQAREAALDQAPLVNARTSLTRFDWIADSDSRLGPVCEIVTAGHYRWLPFSDIATWQIVWPSNLVDLVWAPCVLTLVDGTAVCGFMPARYPGSEAAGGDGAERDALRLGRKTLWHDSGRTGVIASGQKTWATSAGEFGLFELETCEFGASGTQGAPVQEDVNDDQA